MFQIAKEKYDRVVAMSRAGLKIDKICEFVGISRTTVKRIRKAEGMVDVCNSSDPNAKISKDKVDKILQMGRDGCRVSEIAEACGVAKMTVRNHLRKAGIEIRNGRQKLSDDTLNKILQMGRDGYTALEIVEACGTTENTVRDRLKRAGIKPGNGNQRISQETIDKILQMGRNGHSVSEIAKACSVTKKTVRRHLSDIPEEKPAAKPMDIPDMKKYKVVMELSNGKGNRFIREMDICALSERDAINSAFREVSAKYSLHYKVIKSVHRIDDNETEVPTEKIEKNPIEEKKVEEKPVQKKSNNHVKIAATTKTFEIKGNDTGFFYFVAIERDVVRLSIDHENGANGLSFEFKLSDVEGISEEIFEVFDIISAETENKKEA